uniref:Uncharacterized protein n=1 Tax=viral metagenome TaxID=1070528 RepID=A0A6C0DWF2_9ZZZZ
MKQTKKRGSTKRKKRSTRRRGKPRANDARYMVYKKNNILICIRAPVSSRKRRFTGGIEKNPVSFLRDQIFRNIIPAIKDDDTLNKKGLIAIGVTIEDDSDVSSSSDSSSSVPSSSDSSSSDSSSSDSSSSDSSSSDSSSSASSSSASSSSASSSSASSSNVPSSSASSSSASISTLTGKSSPDTNWRDFTTLKNQLISLPNNASQTEKNEIAEYVLARLYEDVKEYGDVIDAINQKQDIVDKTLVAKIVKFLFQRQLLVSFIDEIGKNAQKLKIDEKTAEDIKASIQKKMKVSTTSMSSSAMKAITNGSIMLGKWLTPTYEEEDETNETTVEFLFNPDPSITFNKNKLARGIGDENDREYGHFIVMVNPTKYSHFANKLSDSMYRVENILADTFRNYYGKNNLPPFKKNTYTIKGQQKRRATDDSISILTA